ncbi:MAG: DUF262 domain-containing protein [Methylococcales bacterium]
MSIENLLQQIREAKVYQRQTNEKVGHLINDFNERDIVIPEYQRQFVWDTSIQSRFIESIFMAVPIPAIFLLETTDEQGITKKEVIDGVQRLSTLVSFFNNKLRLSKGLKLSGLDGQRYESLDGAIKKQFLNRDISIITIEKNTDSTIQFEIFERLNRGSVSLTHQELRNCMYHGEFNSFLSKISIDNEDYRELLSEFSNFKAVEKGKPDKSRMQDVEMVLRFFYLFESSYEFSLGDSKNRFGYPTKEQLNSYMRIKKEQEKHNEDSSDVYLKSKEELEVIFNKVCQMVKLTFRNNQFKKFSLSNNKTKLSNAFNKAFFDIQMLGFVDYEIEDITGITDIIYNEFVELCYFNPVMMDNTNEKISERINTWKDLLLNIVNAETDFFLDKLNRKIEHFNFNPVCLSCSEKVEELNEGYLDLENNAFYHAACYIKENKTLPKRNFQRVLGGKLHVTFLDNNKEVYCSSSSKTFVEALQIMNLDNVANLRKMANGHPLVSHEKFRPKDIHQCENWYIDTLSNTDQKKSFLETISKELNIPIRVEIV